MASSNSPPRAKGTAPSSPLSSFSRLTSTQKPRDKGTPSAPNSNQASLALTPEPIPQSQRKILRPIHCKLCLIHFEPRPIHFKLRPIKFQLRYTCSRGDHTSGHASRDVAFHEQHAEIFGSPKGPLSPKHIARRGSRASLSSIASVKSMLSIKSAKSTKSSESTKSEDGN
jgi:hypothetical protein